jgi:hypothetical protein
MRGFFRAGGAAVVAAALVLLALPSVSHAQSGTTGTVHFRVSKAGFIVGVGGGTGTLTFHGKTYPLRVDGMSLGTIGAASATLTGKAYNLRSPTDIAGTYTTVSGSIAAAGGVKIARLQNQNGVVLDLQGRQAGFEASFSLSGVTVSMR